MKRWLTPAALTALASACAVLGKCWTDTAAGLERVENARWQRENGMAFYEDAFKGAVAERMRLEAAVLAATDLDVLKQTVKDNER